MAEKTIFQKIADREIPGDIVYEDDLCLCFRDISPQAPVHLLLVPRKLIVRIGEAETADQDLLGHLLTRVRIIAEQEGLSTASPAPAHPRGPPAEMAPRLGNAGHWSCHPGCCYCSITS